MDKQCWKWTSVHGQATSTVFYAPRSEPTPVAARLSSRTRASKEEKEEEEEEEQQRTSEPEWRGAGAAGSMLSTTFLVTDDRGKRPSVLALDIQNPAAFLT